jgi:hypothetical protein
VSAVPEVAVPDITVEEKKGSGKLIAIAAVLLLGGGGAAYFLTRGGDPPPTATNEAPTTVIETPVAATTPEVPVEEPPTMEAETNPTPAPMHRVEVTITSSPSGAEVFVGERSYGSTPASVVWVGSSAEPGREVQFRFELDDHDSTTVTRTIEGATLAVEAELPRTRRFVPSSMMGSSMSTTMTGGGSEPEFGVTPNNYRDNPD